MHVRSWHVMTSNASNIVQASQSYTANHVLQVVHGSQIRMFCENLDLTAETSGACELCE